MRPPDFTPEEQDALLSPTYGQPVRQFAPKPAPLPRRQRTQAPRDRRVYDARRRLAESRATLAAVRLRGDLASIAEAERWVAHRAEGLSRLLAELGLPPETP
jgi:hypothetical protein